MLLFLKPSHMFEKFVALHEALTHRLSLAPGVPHTVYILSCEEAFSVASMCSEYTFNMPLTFWCWAAPLFPPTMYLARLFSLLQLAFTATFKSFKTVIKPNPSLFFVSRMTSTVVWTRECDMAPGIYMAVVGSWLQHELLDWKWYSPPPPITSLMSRPPTRKSWTNFYMLH